MNTAAPLSRNAQVIRIDEYRPKPGFTGRDLSELQRWAAEGGRFEVAESGDEDHPGQFAMLYGRSAGSANWAVTRQSGSVLVWNCTTLRDLGRFGSMAAALTALLGTAGEEAVWAASADVIPFRAAR